MRCFSKYPSINITDQETDDNYPNPSPSIRFHIYHLIALCTKDGRLPLTDKKFFHKCQHDTASGQSTKIYTRKELVRMETTISNFHTSFYIPAIQKLEFHIPHVHILGTNHCGEFCQTTFKRRKWFQDVLRRRDYAESLVASFTHQIKSEYYSGNRSVSIEGIILEYFSEFTQIEINSPAKPYPRHTVFHIFLSDDSKQYAATTTSHSNHLIELLKKKY